MGDGGVRERPAADLTPAVGGAGDPDSLATGVIPAARELPGALAWSIVSKVLVSLLAIASNVLIVRGLGDYGYGVYSLFLNIAHFLAPLTGLGLAQAVLQFLPEQRVHRNALGARQLLRSSLIYQLAAWVAAAVVIFLLRHALSGLFKADLSSILVLGTLLLIFELLWNLVSNVYMAVRHMRLLTLSAVAQRVTLIVLLVALTGAGLKVPAVLYAVAASFIAGILILVPGMPRLLPWVRAEHGSGISSGRLMRYAIPIAIGAVVNQVLWRSSETLIIGHYWRPEDVGYFNAAYNLPQMILEFVPLAIWPLMLAALSEVHAQRSADLARGVRLYFRLLFVLVVPVSLTGAVLGGQAFLALYGQTMAPGAMICQAFFPIFLISFFTTPLRMALYVKEHAMLNTVIAGVGAVINIVLDFVFIPRYGIWGGVPPVTIALLVSGVLQYVYSRRLLPEIGIPWAHFLKVLAGSVIVLPLWWLRTAFAAPLPLAAVLIGATLLQYLILRMLRVLGDEERELLLRSHLPLKRQIASLLAPR